MSQSSQSLIHGLDPQALFGLSTHEASGGEWQPPSLEEAAQLFPQWKVIRLLGRGGMGAVYEMHQPELDRTVAVKLLPIEASHDEHLVERFRREARTLAKLRHPGIVALLESGITSAGHLFFVMEHVDGSPLSQWIAEGRLDVFKVIEIVRQVCDALAYAHAQGVIHRDIKPANILLDAQGHAKVADFGLARIEQAQTASGALDVSRTGQFMGTPAYAAPEQVKDAAHVDHRADIYALGVLLYEMLTGDLPRGVFQPPSRKTGSDVHLDDVVRRAMQERPEDRYQAAAELKDDVTRSRSTKPAHRSRSPWRTAGIIGVALLLAAVLIPWRQWLGFVMVATASKVEKPVDFLAPKTTDTPQRAAPETRPAMPSPAILPAPAPAPAPVPVPAPPAAKQASTSAEPPPAASSATTIHTWSLEPVAPALQPPAALTKEPWQDAVLTRTGGAALLADGTVSIWHESRPNTVQQSPVKAQSLGNSGDRVLAIDASNRLIDVESGKMLMEGCEAVFSSAKPGIVPVMTSGGEAALLELATHEHTPLPKADMTGLAVDAQGTVWRLLRNGELQKLDGSAFAASPQQGVSTAAHLAVGAGFMALVESNGRCVLFGAGVTDSPQRFRLPAGTRTLRAGPQGRMVAW